jgi:hypothetical protein
MGAVLPLAPGPEWLLPVHWLLLVLFLVLRTASLLLRLRAAGEGGNLPWAAFFTGALVVYAGLAAWLGTTTSTTGDEPYYLMVAGSLAADRDLILDEQFTPAYYGSFYWRRHLAPQNMVRTPEGWRSNAYTTLFPLVLAPGSLLHPRWGPLLIMILLAAALSAELQALAMAVTGDRRAALTTWGVVSFTLPVLSFAPQVYPEIAAALLVALLARWMLSPGVGWARLALPGLLLPALKLRYLPISVAVAAWWAWGRKGLRGHLKIGAWLLLGGAALVALDWAVFHKMILLSRFGAPGLIFRIQKLVRFFPSALLGLSADAEFGLVTYAPLYLLVPAGAVLAWRERGRTPLPLLLPLTAYLGVLIGHFGHLWYGGFSQPSRYLVAVLPLAVPFLALVWSRCRGRLLDAATLVGLAWSLGVGIPFFLKPGFRLHNADGLNPLLDPLGRWFHLPAGRWIPSFLNSSALTAGEALLGFALLIIPSGVVLAATSPRRGRRVWVLILAGLFLLVAAGFVWSRSSVLEAESMAHRGGKLFTGYGRGPVRVFDRPGWVEARVDLPDRGLLTITAGAKAPGDAPVLALFLDGEEVAVVPVAAKADAFVRRDYPVPLPRSGRHLLRLEVRPVAAGGGTVYLDRLRVGRAP